MKFVHYDATPGLERFPERKRFHVWNAAHKRLMREDAEYRQRVRRFRFRMVWPGIAYPIFSLLGTFVMLRAGGTLLTISLGAMLVVTLAYLVLGYRDFVAAFRLQEFLNEKIGQVLQQGPTKGHLFSVREDA